MHDLPDNLPAIGTARLPTAYEAAVAAMSKASTIDECREWTNRAEALASYARQSRDESLYRMAIRIQARATRRCGELLEQVQRADGTRTDLQPRAGDGPRLTRTHVADDAGLSNRQRKTALRVAAVPADDFERQVESEAAHCDSAGRAGDTQTPACRS